jgi:hypothetical protein
LLAKQIDHSLGAPPPRRSAAPGSGDLYRLA